MAIRVGCGSWGDQEYVGLLYPPGLPAAKRLQAAGFTKNRRLALGQGNARSLDQNQNPIALFEL
jgi:hypothetical protein